MLTGKELGQAIKVAIELKKQSGSISSMADVARHFNVSSPAVSDWIKRGTISKDKLPELWTYFSDVVEMTHWGLSSDSNSFTPPRPVYTWTNEDELREGDILIPALELKLSAGHGETVFEVDRKGRGRAFQKDYLERMEINPDCAATMVVSGNSMGPRLIDGDSILVDYCRQTILDGRVYAFVWQEEYFIKRIFKESGGALRLQSDNPDKTLYPDRLITTEHLHEFRLIGQVVGLVGGKI